MLRFAATCAAAFVLLLPAMPAQADMTLSQFRNYSSMPGGSSLVRSFLGGVRDGIMMHQTMLGEQQTLAPTICPDDEALEAGTLFEETLFNEIANPSSGEPWPEDIRMSRLAVHALQEAFPCESY